MAQTDHPDCRWRPSPNFGPRAEPARINTLVLHYTGMPEGKIAENWLASSNSQVSSHYLVYESGDIVQLVAERARAWHAGKSCWAGETDINSCSIGIEIVNPGHEFGYRPFPDTQIDAVMTLCQGIMQRHPIEQRRILAHADVAPDRKEDPGEYFPWGRLHEAGIGCWVPPSDRQGGQFLALADAGDPVSAYQGMLALYGYCVAPTGRFDQATHDCTVAFQRHFRPGKFDGIADFATVETLHQLIASI